METLRLGVILGLTGTLCSGKSSIAEYLQICYGFQIVNLDSKALYPELSSKPYVEDSDEVTYREEAARCVLHSLEENMQTNYVVFPITLARELEVFRQSTSFMLIGVDGPVAKRFEHYKKKYSKAKTSVQDFCKLDDKVNYGLENYPSNVYECVYIADKVLLNCSEQEDLHAQLRALDVLNPEHLRPNWDTYFIRLAELASTRSNCMKRPIGAIIVKDHRIVATGYNGTPYGTINCCEGGCERCNSGAREGTKLDLCACVHAEANAILHAGRLASVGGTLYTSTFPCLACSKTVIQAGITRIVYHKSYDNSEISQHMLNQAGIEVVQHSPIIPSPVLD
jgi:dCMP deaminase